MTGARMAAEIAEQPAVLGRLLDESAAAVREVAAVVRRRSPRFVLLVARGTSDHAALYAKYLAEIRLGLPAGLVSPSAVTLYGSRPDLRDVLVVAVSQSGRSPDLVETVAVARSSGATTLAVTNSPGSELAATAELTLDVGAGEESAVAATKSYSAELMALYLVLDACAGGDGEQARAVPDVVAALVDRHSEVTALAQRYRFATGLVLTARGYSYPTAREGALKLMETSYVAALAYSGADLMHGPVAVLDASHPVVAVVPDGATSAAMAPVLEAVVGLGADLLVLGGDHPVPQGARLLRLPGGLPEELHPLVDIVPLQWLALDVSVDRGLDPDAPRGLAKVTRTR